MSCTQKECNWHDQSMVEVTQTFLQCECFSHTHGSHSVCTVGTSDQWWTLATQARCPRTNSQQLPAFSLSSISSKHDMQSWITCTKLLWFTTAKNVHACIVCIRWWTVNVVIITHLFPIVVQIDHSCLWMCSSLCTILSPRRMPGWSCWRLHSHCTWVRMG